MHQEAQKEHHWLAQLVGEWESEADCVMEPGQPAMKSTGKEVVRSMGGVWMVCEGTMNLPEGGTGTSIMSLGYDPSRGRFVGTFIASMMTFLWIYDGELDASQKVLSLYAEGPGFVPGAMAKYCDTLEIVSASERTLTSHLLQPDGTRVLFMKATYRRTK